VPNISDPHAQISPSIEQKMRDSRDAIRRHDDGFFGLNAMSALIERPHRPSAGPMAETTVVLKDNIDIVGTPTTAGSQALRGAMPRKDSSVVSALLDAGATIVGKTNQLELSGWLTFSAPPGYSALGGRALNPRDPRLSTGGSSSGAAVAVAAGYADVAIGTDTGGSVLNPAGMNGAFGLRPTVGRVGTAGIVPVSSRQDTPGPISLSTAVLARTLSALSADVRADFEAKLDAHRLEGLRIGVPILSHVGEHAAHHWRARLALLRDCGAILVPVLSDLRWRGHGDLTVPAFDFREGIDIYLDGVTAPSGVHDFASLLEHYLSDPVARMPYGGENLLRSARVDLDRDRADADGLWAREQKEARGVLDAAFDRLGIDVLVFPHGGAAYLSSKSGYPALTLPGVVGADAQMHYTTALATQPDAEQLLLDLARGVEETSGSPFPAFASAS
jgi:amidase